MSNLNPFESLLIKVTNVSAASLARILPGETKVVFRSPSWFFLNPGIEEGVLSGKLKVEDLARKAVPAHSALAGIAGLKRAAEDLNRALEMSPGSLSSYAAQVAWNIETYPYIIAVVRADTLSADLGDATPASILQSLAPAVTLSSLGMFAEAAATVRLVPVNSFLTSARLELYASILESANAIV